MGVFIYRKRQFKKLMDDLRRAGGKGPLAAKLAEEIVEKVACGHRLLPSQTHRLIR